MNKKTLIAIPCMDMVAAPFASSLAMLQKEGEVTLSMLMNSLIYESRNKLAKQAVSIGADYVLWLDSDMTFTADTLVRMLRHMEDGKEIVTGLYFRRAAPFTPVIFRPRKDPTAWYDDFNDYPADSVFEIGACGFGCVMTKTSVFLDLALHGEPWFNPVGRVGEDIAFCERATRLNHPIYCDSSIKCGHVGHLTVTEEIFRTMSGGEN